MNMEWFYLTRFEMAFSYFDILNTFIIYLVVSAICEYPSYSRTKRLKIENIILKNQVDQLSGERSGKD